MNTLLTLLLFTTVYHGNITYYNPGLFATVANNRLVYKQITPCPECIGYVALVDCQELNSKVYLQIPHYGLFGPYLAVDCAAKQHVKTLRQKQCVAEIDYLLAMQLKMRGPLPGVTIYVIKR